ncbi:uncharacterized protein LOC124447814 [Xenia sp. Carnegie-2017]|uniref:uncharacterized protein LOC124447814 n=1 Tax=Xenia sp. Carnegie-2017 TaxID=2897299 RepID=UPI001F03ED30|nr:uncharacterized protein LOC124447814 [Xenia sp. Carnegie-2017]
MASKKYPRRSFQEKRKATPSILGRKSPSGTNVSAPVHAANGNIRWSQSSGEGKMNGTARSSGLYTNGDRTQNGRNQLAKFPKPGRRPGYLSGSDTESGRRRGGRNYVSDDEADVRRRRHRRRRHNRGYASAGDASGTETEGVSNVENPRTRIRGYHPVNPEVPYDPTAQWVDSTQNIPGATRERQGRSYEDVRTRQRTQNIYKSEPDILLSPALVPVQKSSVSVARVREDHAHTHRYSGSHLPHDSLYKVRSESANNKLNFKVLLELGPETGMPTDVQATHRYSNQRGGTRDESHYINHRSRGGYKSRLDDYEHARKSNDMDEQSSRYKNRRSNDHFLGMKSTEL